MFIIRLFANSHTLFIVIISIILPIPDPIQNTARPLAGLSSADDYDLIVVSANQEALTTTAQARFVPCGGSNYVTHLMAGIAEANGDVLLFLQPNHHLPTDSLQAIRRNFELLPQTVGGNFNLKFKPTSALTSLLKPLLKRRRYQGYYFFDSGIFIRKNAYEAIGGLQTETNHADLDLVRRMEQYGPTLYLPDNIIAPPPTFSQALKWLAAPILTR